VADDRQELLAALASPIRREILWLVRDRELPAGEIAAAFTVSAPTISQHLAVLRAAGLVDMRVDGTFRRYRARMEVLEGLERLIAADGRWRPEPDLPERARTSGLLEQVVRTWIEVSIGPVEAFDHFVDQERFSRWLRVPVTLDDRRFACTMEFGPHIRGHYDLVVPPELIAMRWDFDLADVPVPGDERVSYLRITPTAAGSRIEVQQFADGAREVEYMQAAWAMVLGRLAEHLGGR
jgi:DNA-binding transcriptional ArsR family regulator/uncharacterized protein YndB with AHSA1/START domain